MPLTIVTPLTPDLVTIDSNGRMRTIIIVQEVEVHGWLLSCSEDQELTILCCSLLFLTLVANK